MTSIQMISSKVLKQPPLDLTKIESRYLCPECKGILNEVHQADDCGCRFCYECLDKIIKNGSKICPSCGIKLQSSTLIPDKHCQKKINNLQIEKCAVDMCNWSGNLLNYKDHYFVEHFAPKCQYCNLEFKTKNDFDKHLDKEKGDCLKQPIECIYKSIGCTLSLPSERNLDANQQIEKMEISNNEKDTISNDKIYLTRETFDLHMSLNVKNHLELVYKYVNKLNLKIDQSSLNLSEHFNSAFRNKLNDSNSAYSEATALDNKNTNKEIVSSFLLKNSNVRYGGSYVNNPDDGRYFLDAKKKDLNSNVASNSYSNDLSNEENLNATTESMLVIDQDILNTVQDQVNTLENSQRNLITDLSRLYKSLEKLKVENQTLRENLKEYKTISQELHKTLALTQVSLLTLEERLINQEKVSYNGILLWKITNVHERIQEAKSGRQTSFYSPPFYTDRNGFKMCARIYLNGDGNGRNTHLSLFFVILRGEYDALLRWPFRQKVTFILIDQSLSESKENVYDAFRPDPNSSSFRRPISEMNIASGLPVFCPMSKLMSADHEYIKDNTMFIKIIVETKDLTEI